MAKGGFIFHEVVAAAVPEGNIDLTVGSTDGVLLQSLAEAICGLSDQFVDSFLFLCRGKGFP